MSCHPQSLQQRISREAPAWRFLPYLRETICPELSVNPKNDGIKIGARVPPACVQRHVYRVFRKWWCNGLRGYSVAGDGNGNGKACNGKFLNDPSILERISIRCFVALVPNRLFYPQRLVNRGNRVRCYFVERGLKRTVAFSQ